MDWLAIASADHVEIGKREGFMQVCHGKGGPLRGIRPADRVIYYAPTKTYGTKDGLMSFVAFGIAEGNAPYRHDMGGGFVPFRLDVRWLPSRPVPIRPLLDHLELTRGKANWAYPFRFGLLPLSRADCDLLAAEMAVDAGGFASPDPSASEPEALQMRLF